MCKQIFSEKCLCDHQGPVTGHVNVRGGDGVQCTDVLTAASLGMRVSTGGTSTELKIVTDR